ncbi:Protein MS5 [Arabidopsis thaliana x Arabidopsis arenosa]|uniref:Protein MS5 n=1 Tax=Arabidopsis thaliana x Arabidopsis arenosa TaxID=1240361 RepID=A0A8T2B3K8_9BRAS|nr:Protein MS5 [Arabidopsis thaliana x Arabidopsis arenosa]
MSEALKITEISRRKGSDLREVEAKREKEDSDLREKRSRERRRVKKGEKETRSVSGARIKDKLLRRRSYKTQFGDTRASHSQHLKEAKVAGFLVAVTVVVLVETGEEVTEELKAGEHKGSVLILQEVGQDSVMVSVDSETRSRRDVGSVTLTLLNSLKLKDSELQDNNDWIRLYLELVVATTDRNREASDFGLSNLEIVNVAIDAEGLYARNAIFYIRYKDLYKARLGKADFDRFAIVRRSYDEDTGLFTLVGQNQSSDFIPKKRKIAANEEETRCTGQSQSS